MWNRYCNKKQKYILKIHITLQSRWNTFFSSGWLCQQSHCPGAGVRRPFALCPSIRLSSVNSGLRKPLHGSRPHFAGSYLPTTFPNHYVLFQNVRFSNFYDVVFFFHCRNGTHGSENFKTLLLPQFLSEFYQTFVTKIFVTKTIIVTKIS